MAKETMIPLLAIAAWSGTGKTTLLKKLIPALCAHGIRPGLIKHTHHDMDVDKPGKDSYELRKAGRPQTLVASQQRWALMTETPGQEELDLAWLVSRDGCIKAGYGAGRRVLNTRQLRRSYFFVRDVGTARKN
ncbi:molybdopterin-guanine dinucleotide biosynthesis protein B [Salmonella enterica subsp. enterica]|uniref:Molybdopterin-guanine dinucleotide biosynthesis protein B n=1 Tax=Salmonella enterica I TaxID=59201 RepID=A0A379X3K0_SALET|nr:molybdopterin-guanine dinucleotide biosynthesis protein B [Salmonella enterica subsp. enterica]